MRRLGVGEQIARIELVIEHTFITTLDSHEALTEASSMLGRGGFAAEAQGAFQIDGGGWTTLQMRRGRKSATRAKNPTECPQLVRLEWDRGRITVAASIEPTNDRNRAFLMGGVIGLTIAASSRRGKSAKQCSELMVTIANSLESLLARRASADEACAPWVAFEQQLNEQARRARVRSWIYLAIFLAFIAVVIALIIANAK